MRANKHVEFADVVWTLVRTISKLDYKYVANDVIYFSVCAGEAFDELNYRKIAGAERKARMAYKFGAMFAQYEKPLTACEPSNIRWQFCNWQTPVSTFSHRTSSAIVCKVAE